MRHISRRDFITSHIVLLGGLVFGKATLAESLSWQHNRCDNKFIQGAFPLPERIASAVRDVFGSTEVAASQQLNIVAPCVAESAVVVPVTIGSDLADIQRIAVFADHNTNPLITVIQLTPRSHLPISLHLQLEYKLARIYVVCEAKNKLYSSSTPTKVNMQCSGDLG